jgi:hypothetical protein
MKTKNFHFARLFSSSASEQDQTFWGMGINENDTASGVATINKPILVKTKE